MASDEHWTDLQNPVRTYFTRQVCPAPRRTKGIMSILSRTDTVVASIGKKMRAINGVFLDAKSIAPLTNLLRGANGL